ncbi:MAG: hypothetical protein LBB81_05480 [Treponema sp.]|jgi:prenyltransferase beta subunit|nr:hypothetical protein [Treponema sp.]
MKALDNNKNYEAAGCMGDNIRQNKNMPDEEKQKRDIVQIILKLQEKLENSFIENSVNNSGGWNHFFETKPNITNWGCIYGILLWGEYSDKVNFAKEYLVQKQNNDGGWSVEEKRCPSQISLTRITSQALNALGSNFLNIDHNVIKKAIDWLINAQKEDGGWGLTHPKDESGEGAEVCQSDIISTICSIMALKSFSKLNTSIPGAIFKAKEWIWNAKSNVFLWGLHSNNGRNLEISEEIFCYTLSIIETLLICDDPQINQYENDILGLIIHNRQFIKPAIVLPNDFHAVLGSRVAPPQWTFSSKAKVLNILLLTGMPVNNNEYYQLVNDLIQGIDLLWKQSGDNISMFAVAEEISALKNYSFTLKYGNYSYEVKRLIGKNKELNGIIGLLQTKNKHFDEAISDLVLKNNNLLSRVTNFEEKLSLVEQKLLSEKLKKIRQYMYGFLKSLVIKILEFVKYKLIRIIIYIWLGVSIALFVIPNFGFLKKYENLIISIATKSSMVSLPVAILTFIPSKKRHKDNG